MSKRVIMPNISVVISLNAAKFFASFLVLLFSQFFTFCQSTPWWSPLAQLALHQNPELYVASTKPLCSQLHGLSPGQARVCDLFTDHMPAVGRGAKQAILECQNQFKTRRWNCSTHFDAGIFGPIHVLGTKEAAFTYAIVAVGVAQEIARNCRSGVLSTCGCSKEKRPSQLHGEWMWNSCSGDNIDYGNEFSKNFIDIREQEKEQTPKTPEYGRSLMARWNSEIGRKVVKRKAKIACKCHGVSGSCNLKTCWRQTAPISDVGAVLLEKYDNAIQVRVNKRGNLQVVERRQIASGGAGQKDRFRQKRAPKMDLVYLEESPDYCSANPNLQTIGTEGRTCNRGSQGIDSCELLCCGRGHNTFKRVITEKCKCQFQWCCKVVCKTCQTEIETHVCK